MLELPISELELEDLYRLIKTPSAHNSEEIASIYRTILEKNFGTEAAQKMIFEINEADESIIKSFKHLGITKSLLLQCNLPQSIRVTAQTE